MQTYITQLIEDLHASIDRAAHTVNQPEESFDDYIADVERYLHEEATETIHEIIGISEDYFPPADRLNKDQLNGVCIALLDCLGAWNMCIDMPEKLPITLAYTLLVSALKKKIVLTNSGVMHMELCDYDSDDCPFGLEYCRCIDTDIEDMGSIDSM